MLTSSVSTIDIRVRVSAPVVILGSFAARVVVGGLDRGDAYSCFVLLAIGPLSALEISLAQGIVEHVLRVLILVLSPLSLLTCRHRIAHAQYLPHLGLLILHSLQV